MKRIVTLNTILFTVIFLTGLFLVFAPPPFQKADEYAHFRRSLMLSQGVLICRAHKTIPVRKDVYSLFYHRQINQMTYEPTKKLNFNEYIKWITQPSHTASVTHLKVADLCTYPIVSYIPQSLSLMITNALATNVYLSFFIGRLSVFLICFASLIYLFKKTSKPFNYIILLVFSLPMSLHQMTSYSYDAFQIIFVLFYFSYLVRLIQKKKIQIREMIVLVILLFLFLLSKPGGYEFLILTVFLIPVQKKQLLHLGSVIALCTGLYFLLRISLYQDVANMTFQKGIDPSFQVKLFLNPIFDVLLILKTTVHHAWFYYKGLIGIFGWLEYGLNGMVYLLYGLLSLFVLNMKHAISLNRLQKIILTFSIGFTYCFLIAINFLFWTKIGSPISDGVQGRYLIPLVPFIFLLGYSLLKKPFLSFQNKPRLFKGLLIVFALFIFFSIIIAVMNRYYL